MIQRATRLGGWIGENRGVIALVSVGFFVLLVSALEHRQPARASHGCSGTTDITSNTTWSTNQCLGDVTVKSGATLTINGNTSHTLSSLTLGDGATNGFITAKGDTASGNGVTLTVDGTVEVKSGSSISADLQGYNGGGPGINSTCSGGICGAGHGAVGGVSLPDLSPGPSYGSAVAPVALGSGSVAATGGGAIKMNIGGNFVHNGTISADGQELTHGGSGGSIWINFTGGSSAWSGGGTIRADGKVASSGGRIAVTGYTSSTFSGTIQAYADNTTTRTSSGTIYLKSTSQSGGTLIIDNYLDVPRDDLHYTTSGVTSLTLDELKVQGNAQFLIPEGSTVTLNSGGVLSGAASGKTYILGTLSLPSTISLSHTLVVRGLHTSDFSFDGVNDYFNSAQTPLNFSGNTTIEGWFRPRAIAGTTQSLIEKYSGTNGYQLYIGADNKVKFWVQNTVVSSSATLSAGTLYHIAGVVSGTTAKIYINGSEDGSGTVSAPASTTAQLYVGRDGVSGTDFFGGTLDEIRISNVARYTGTFTPSSSHTADSNTKALWKLNEAGAGVLYDSSDNNSYSSLDVIFSHDGSTSGWTNITRTASGQITGTTTLTITSTGRLSVDAPMTNANLDVVVQASGVLNHTDNDRSDKYKIDLSIKNLTINASGRVDVDGLGYNDGYGPGGTFGTSSVGASYGGQGDPTSALSSARPTYGSAIAPQEVGSGALTGHDGGGGIKLTLSGNLTNNGTITSSNTNCGTYGSGGAIWINFTGGSSAWSGSGTILADSGCGGSGGKGGGGRVAVTGYVTDTHSGTTTARAYGTGSSGGATGTVYLKSSSQTNGTLIIDDVNQTLPAIEGISAHTGVANLTLDELKVQNRGTLRVKTGETLTVVSSGSITHGANSFIFNDGTFTSTGITHTISGTFRQDGTVNFGSVTVASGGEIDHSDNSTTEVYKANIAAANLTVSSGGLIDVNGLGYDGGAADAAGNGPGSGGAGGASSGGGGGGYGGSGLTGAGASGGAGGTTYGSQAAPVNIGSGGGGGDSAAGGAGGGAIQLTISGNLTVAGTIRANGANGTSGTHGGAGGSGGSIYLTVGGNFNCSGGTVTANGGNGAGTTNSGGGGGGGRIAQNVTGTYTACTTRTVTKGTGGTGGGDGTIYTYAAAPTGFGGGSITSSSITWSWTDASTTETTFRLHDASHSQIASVASTTTAGTGSSYTHNETGLTPDTNYTRHVHAHDGTAESNASGSDTKRTLAAVPGAPTVAAVSSTSLTVTLSVNGNPSSVEFAFGIDNDGNGSIDTNGYVQTNGTLGASAAWQTYTSWGGGSGKTVTGLTPNTSYTFKAKARNSDSVETALSSGGSSVTHAATQSAPTVEATGSTTIRIKIANGTNPAATEFAIYNDTQGKYVGTDGASSASPVWATYASFGGATGVVNAGLTPNTTYSYTTKARNSALVETAFSPAAGSTTAMAPSTPEPVITTSPTPTPKGKKATPTPSPTITPTPTTSPTVSPTVSPTPTATPTPTPSPTTPPVCWINCVRLGVTILPAEKFHPDSFFATITSTPLGHPTEIYFTVDSRTPNTKSVLYRNPIYIDRSTTVKARAYGSVSPVVAREYVIASPPSPTPTPTATPPIPTLSASVTPPGGTFSQPVTVTITASDATAEIFYTTDGSDPRSTGLPYLGPTTLSQSAYLRFYAKTADGLESPIGAEQYIILSEPAPVAVTFDPYPRADERDESAGRPVEYELRCNGQSVSTTDQPDLLDPERRLDGCHYEVGVTAGGQTIAKRQPTKISAPKGGGTAFVSPATLETLVSSQTGRFVYLLPLILFAFNGLGQAWKRRHDLKYHVYRLLPGTVLFGPATGQFSHVGHIVNTRSNTPVPHVLIFIRDEANYGHVVKRIVASARGTYAVKLPRGTYSLSFYKPHFNFPSRVNPSGYHGQKVELTQTNNEFAQDVYLDPLIVQPWWRDWAHHLGFVVERYWWPVLALGWLVSLVLFLYDLSGLNAAILVAYTGLVAREAWIRYVHQPMLVVLDPAGRPIVGTSVYLSVAESGEGSLAYRAMSNGAVPLPVRRGRYVAQILADGQGVLAEETLDFSRGTPYKHVVHVTPKKPPPTG